MRLFAVWFAIYLLGALCLAIVIVPVAEALAVPQDMAGIFGIFAGVLYVFPMSVLIGYRTFPR